MNVTVKGELLEYVTEQSIKTGLSKPSVLVMLAMRGMEQQKAVGTLKSLSDAIMLAEEASRKGMPTRLDVEELRMELEGGGE